MMKLIYVIRHLVVLMQFATMENAHVCQSIEVTHIMSAALNAYLVRIALKTKHACEINV